MEVRDAQGRLKIERRTGCPMKAVDPRTVRWLKMYPHYKNGHLLRTGGIGNQPYKYVEAMAVIDAEINKIQEDENQQRRRIAKGGR